MPEFNNLIWVNYQKLLNVRLKPNIYYYFDFFDAYENYNTLLYSENADVEISALNFNV